MANAYAFNPDRSKAPVYTKEEIDQYCDRSYETVADMQADTMLTAGMICRTLGFHAAGDGGAAWYQVTDDATANGMDVIALDNGLYAILQITEAYVTPEMFGAWGDGVHDDTDIIQAVIDTYKIVQFTCDKEYLVSNIDITTPVCINGNSSTLIANSSSPIISFNFSVYNPSVWSIIENINFDMANIAQNALLITNTRNVKFENLYFYNFNNASASSDFRVAAIREVGDNSAPSGTGYERYFDTLVFYPNIASEDFAESYADYIWCIRCESAGDDVWNNVVCHSCPHPVYMYNWTTVMNNFHLIADSSNQIPISCAFDLRSSGPYILNNIYLDTCPYGFLIENGTPVIANNISIANPVSSAVEYSTLFYIASAQDRGALRNTVMRNVYSKYANAKLTGYSSGGAFVDIDIISPENFIDLDSDGAYSYSPTFDGSFTGSIVFKNLFNGTYVLTGYVKVSTGFTVYASGNPKTLFTVPSYCKIANSQILYSCASTNECTNAIRATIDDETNYLQMHDSSASHTFAANDRIQIEIPVLVVG